MESFSEKIKQKKLLDAQILSSASKSVYSPIENINGNYNNNLELNSFILELQYIIDFFDMEMPKFPKKMIDSETINQENLIQFLMSETGIMRRKVVLKDNWWKYGSTPLLCTDIDDNYYALIPSANGGYLFFENNKKINVTKKNSKKFNNVCYCFYQPMENKALSLIDFYLFICKAFSLSDIVWLLSVSFITGLMGMFMPATNQFIFNYIVPSGTSTELFGIGVFIFGVVIIQALCRLARSLWVMRIGNKIELLLQNAIWSRLLSLPVTFFKNYSSGELSQKIYSVDDICSILGGQFIPTILGSMFSFIYLFQISYISSVMIMPSIIIIIFTLIINIIITVMKIKRMSYNNKMEGKLLGMVFQFLEGITKIKIAGAEIRVFQKWAELYSQLRIMPSKVYLFLIPIRNAINFGGTIVLYIIAYKNSLSASEYIAFNTAFVLFLTAITELSDVSTQFAILKPSLDMLKPILEETPENSGYKKQVNSLNGDIEINQVKFRYNDEMPYVLDGLVLNIKKGDYIGIVGSSGCGKSTLVRILLGFEKPQSGSIYYDMQDIESLDIRSVRKRIGVVLQNGKLFAGDIYSNIVITAPWLTVDDAWEAARRSGFAEDIKNMPMGMFTMISEGGGGLSGGQQQRLLITRAIVSNPDIIIFDEATSALDNLTQSIVVKTLEEMSCTRLIIAHRLSTIKNCSKIVYLDKGKIVESGTYDELMKLGGKFYQMAQRQLI